MTLIDVKKIGESPGDKIENGIIYIITNDCNNKVYIGQTTRTLETRWKHHLRTANSNKAPHFAIHNALLKYGFEHFKISVIEENIPYSELNQKEEYWINFYNSKTPNGYNLTNGGDDCGRKEIYQINIYSNEIVNKYGSITEAAEKNNLDKSMLSKVCREYKNYASLGGYKWCFVDNYDYEKIKNKKARCTRKIYQINFETAEVIALWNSVKEASDSLNIGQSLISSCLNKKHKTAGGYCWCYIDEIDAFILPQKIKKVIQYDIKTKKIIQEWDSALNAAIALKKNSKYASNIRSACSGKQKSAYGFLWKYKEVTEHE